MTETKRTGGNGARGPAKTSTAGGKTPGFSDFEKAAMKERVRELKAEARRGAQKEDGERELLAKIAELTEPDRTIGARLHAIITANAPSLFPKTWYGMPAYANQNGKVVLFFRDRQKFSERYITFGFNQEAKLDDGAMWPIAFALTELTADGEAKIARLVKQAVG